MKNIRRDVQKTMGRTFVRGFDWLLAPIEEINRRPKEFLQSPATAIARMQRKMERRFQPLAGRPDGGEIFLRQIVDALPLDAIAGAEEVGIASLARKEGRRIARSKIGRDLLALIDEADRAVRHSPCIVQPEPTKHGQETLLARGRLLAIDDERGEARARALWSAAAAIAEPLYLDYLRRLWQLAELAEGRWPRDPPAFGKLVESLRTRLARFPNLLVPLCARVRNAVDHGHIDYNGRSRRIEMNNKDGWRAEMRTRELEALTRAMLREVDIFRDSMHHFLNSRFLTALIPPFLSLFRAMKSRDDSETERAAAAINDVTEQWFSDLRAFAIRAAS